MIQATQIEANFVGLQNRGFSEEVDHNGECLVYTDGVTIGLPLVCGVENSLPLSFALSITIKLFE